DGRPSEKAVKRVLNHVFLIRCAPARGPELLPRQGNQLAVVTLPKRLCGGHIPVFEGHDPTSHRAIGRHGVSPGNWMANESVLRVPPYAEIFFASCGKFAPQMGRELIEGSSTPNQRFRPRAGWNLRLDAARLSSGGWIKQLQIETEGGMAVGLL